MLNIKLNGKEGSIALVSMLICSAVIIGIPIFEQNNNVRAVSSWLDETDADFNEGTLDNVEIDGTGSDAVLKLKSIGGYWEERVLSTNPKDRDLYGFAGVYNTDKVVVFGGHSSSQTKYNDTWIFDLSEGKWTDAKATASPAARHTMGMDGIWGTDRVLMFGGQTAPSSVTENDTWVYDLSDNKWTELFPNTAPSPVREHAIANFWGTDKVLTFGGMPINNETWLYDLTKYPKL